MLQKIWRYLIPVAAALLVGGLAALLTQGDFAKYAAMEKPPLSPPSWVFPVVWTALFLMMGYAAYIVTSIGGTKAKEAMTVYYAQLFFNFLWSILFFRAGLYLVAVFDLIILIAVVTIMVIRFSRIDEKAGYLTLPYLIWLCFALYLNIGVAALN